jgi:hypothetical protein
MSTLKPKGRQRGKGVPFSPERAREVARKREAGRRAAKAQAESDRTGEPIATVLARWAQAGAPRARRREGVKAKDLNKTAVLEGGPPLPPARAGAKVSAAQESGTPASPEEFEMSLGPPALAASPPAVREPAPRVNVGSPPQVPTLGPIEQSPPDDDGDDAPPEIAPELSEDAERDAILNQNANSMFELYPEFKDWSWSSWRTFMKVLDALPLSPEELAIFQARTGRVTPPSKPVREAHVIVGRRGGKTATASLIAVDRATRSRKWKLAPGETATIPLIAADRQQASVLMGYVRGLLGEVPRFKRLIVGKPARERIDLSNRTRIAVHTASFRTTRGYTLAAAVCDEIAFWRNEETSANPDREVIAAIKPGLLTSGGPLIIISSPYARSGVLWDAYRKYYGVEDATVLVWKATSLEMNPMLPEEDIAAAYEEDPQAASAEYGGEFRADLETFISEELLMRLVAPGRRELEPA